VRLSLKQGLESPGGSGTTAAPSLHPLEESQQLLDRLPMADREGQRAAAFSVLPGASITEPS
jgi:hypothetical protein